MRRLIFERRIEKFAPKPEITASRRIGQATGAGEMAGRDVPILFHIKFRVPVEQNSPGPDAYAN